MWKKTLCALAVCALIALPAFAEEWRPIISEATSAGVGKPTLAGNVTPIQTGVQHVRVATDGDAWIYFQLTNPDATVLTHTPISAAGLSGRMSQLGMFMPASTIEVFKVSPNSIWHVQGDGGTATVSVTQVSK